MNRKSLFQLLLLLLFSILITLIDSYEPLYIIFNLLLLIILSLSFTHHNVKGWYLGSLFILLYVLPHFFTIYNYGGNYMIRDESYYAISSNLELNVYAIKLTILYVVSLYMGVLFFNKRRDINKNNVENTVVKISRLKFYSLLLMIVLLLVFAISKLDFQLMKETYTLGSGFSILFGVFYIMNFFIVYIFLTNKVSQKVFIIFLMIYFFILGYLGVRQVMLWLLLALYIAYAFKLRYISNLKINYIKIFLYFSIFLIISAIVLGYRDSKTINLDLQTLINLIGFAYLWETSFTVHNFFASLELSKSTDFFFMSNFLDIITLLIPSFLLENKADYLVLNQFSKLYDITPFGTYFILGELKLSLRYDILIMLYGIIISFLSESFQNKVIVKRDILLIALYSFFIIFIFIYPVRGGIPSGIKIFLMFNLLMYFVLKYRIKIVKG
jgi:hypothetical protein